VSSNRTIFLNSTISKEYNQPMYMIRSPQNATIQYNNGVLVSKIFRRRYLVFLSNYDHQANIPKSDYSQIHQPNQVSQTVGSQYRKSRNESLVFLSDYGSVILHHTPHLPTAHNHVRPARHDYATVGSQYRKQRSDTNGLCYLFKCSQLIPAIHKFPSATTMQQWGLSIEKNVSTPFAM